ncbi:MAG: sucrase ferredoxin [Cyanobacteria bacterium P01_F01_bin.53]
MKPSFCAIANQQAGEDLIGTAGHYKAYVLIECPMPWAAKVFDSKHIPSALRDYIKAIKAERSIQFLAVNRGVSSSSDTLTLMVYERTVPSSSVSSGHAPSDSIPSGGVSPVNDAIDGYRGYEFQLTGLSQVVECLEAHWQGDRIGKSITLQDILVCTHGMRDKCCARFGQPFFREAIQSVRWGELPNTRVWKVSHIGGHRFAPTAISLPDGRYYGRLTLSALQAMVTRRGPISQLRSVYRGWGLLPAPLQVLERQLMLNYGWSWFEHKVTYQILEKGPQDSAGEASSHDVSSQRLRKGELLVEMSVEPDANQCKADGDTITYRAKLYQDPQKSVCVRASCSSAIAKHFVKYTVADGVVVTSPQSAIVSETIAVT